LSVALLSLCGCGRIGFHPDGDAGGSALDASDSGSGGCGGAAASIFCSDFETQGLADWDLIEPGASASTAQARSASHSLFGTAGSGAPASERAIKYLPPLTSGSVFVRLFVYIPSTTGLPSTSMSNSSAIATMGAVPAGRDYEEVSFFSTMAQVFGDNSAGNPPTYYAYAQLTASPYDRWMCVEWELTLVAPGSDRAAVYVDGSASPTASATGLTLRPTNGLSVLRVGTDYSGTDGTFQTFTDDVVVATQRVGCQ
jgi:hypothetical protein